ncbi:hypothetical protein PVK06_007547 [Gossypium arboreum]|uniref:Reverse transcriptase domain-containing protein n=1 Tax=Gossypium arboreum TaxID=29729 RepID=A0ABR0QJ02_GOSAR|nr:hypothetical protein PVK06_007547 [Gossypium arboreum]
MRSRKKNRKWMAVKIDLEKAYDQVRWDFIEVSLNAADMIDGFVGTNGLWAFVQFLMLNCWPFLEGLAIAIDRGFLEGTLPTLSRFVASPNGVLTSNPDASVFTQQDKLLDSWLISIIITSLLSCFTIAKSACEIWSTANRLFAASTGAKISRIKHNLHSIKKGDLTIKECIAKIQNICTLLATFGFVVSEAKKVEVILTDFSSNFDAVLTLASFSSKTLPFQKLVDVLREFENR